MLKKLRSNSGVLMLALFATGISGIVSEYVLATMATYFIGDSVFQWTMVLSLMLFAMGLGSRLSKLFEKNLLFQFIVIEFLLSILASFSAFFTYAIMPYTDSLVFIIYTLSIIVGLLIGMEIPLVTRINADYENLKVNISNVMEKDYYGSLIGGIFFAFIGIPFLGLTYTPFVVGGINFLVAIIVLLKFRKMIRRSLVLFGIALLVTASIILGIVFIKPVILWGNQSLYEGKVIYSKQTKYQQITVTQIMEHYWLYLNKGKQLSTFDEWFYHEPLVHSVMTVASSHKRVLVMGAGDGCAVRELLRYDDVEEIVVCDLDPEMTNIGMNHPIFRKINQDAFHSRKVKIVNHDAFQFLRENKDEFDVIIADFPDPRTIELNKLYSLEFYKLCKNRLSEEGAFITQASSPYYTTKAFRTIEKTIGAAGFETLPIHNHVYTFGEWGWVIGSRKYASEFMKDKIRNVDLNDFNLKFWRNDAGFLITSFGADLIPVDEKDIEINMIHNPILYRYYAEGNWSYFF
ncbi:MAG: polyamine aminopropyltransferase [Crocinitomicaceae bacterium]|nr:polyamine aminopropyltransferase [Crocinitomicaceae bacterium]